jgi:hypothetical protein
MTNALCLSCGDLKWGAFCQCQQCGYSPHQPGDLDIFFSDHTFSIKILKSLGEVIKQIKIHCPQENKSLFIFLYYVSQQSPKLIPIEALKKAFTEYEEDIDQKIL